MATYVGKTTDEKEIKYINYVIGMSGATTRQFVRAAILNYCDYLMTRAADLREKALNELRQKQQAMLEKIDEVTDAQSAHGNSSGDNETPQQLAVADSDVLAQPEGGMADPERSNGTSG